MRRLGVGHGLGRGVAWGCRGGAEWGEVLKTLKGAPDRFENMTRNLINREKRKCSSDSRVVGCCEVIEREGGLVLRVGARSSGGGV
jgi:hypothetical protein